MSKDLRAGLKVYKGTRAGGIGLGTGISPGDAIIG